MADRGWQRLTPEVVGLAGHRLRLLTAFPTDERARAQALPFGTSEVISLRDSVTPSSTVRVHPVGEPGRVFYIRCDQLAIQRSENGVDSRGVAGDRRRELLRRWDRLLAPYSISPADVAVSGNMLLQEWTNPHRHHHTLAHILAMMDRVDELSDHAEELLAVQLAGLYQGAVVLGRLDDANRSAWRADITLTRLQLPQGIVAEVVRLIRLAGSDCFSAADSNGATLRDAVRAVLAGSAEHYRTYIAAVRAENSHLTDEQFRAYRAHRLTDLLLSESIYLTPRAQRLWETAAKNNLATDLRSLTVRG